MGGGINGCALARLAAGGGLRTALIEKRDFGAGVTSRSTRWIHGGLRYLESLQLSLVRESLRNRERLLREFPGQVTPKPFLLPAYASDSRRPWYLAAGLGAYRLLARGSSLPPPRRLTAPEVLALLPGLDPNGLLGGFEYFDCQAVYPERWALEMALQAEEHGADIRNHMRAVGFLLQGSRVEGVRLEGPGGAAELRCRVVVNATGAWADRVLGLLSASRPRPLLTLLNGVHIAVQTVAGSPRHAVYHEAHSDRRPFFIVPWRGLYLIGTTETPFDGDPDRALPTEKEIDYLLMELNSLLPGARLGRDSVPFAYSGSRSLLRSSLPDLNRASRDYMLVDHDKADGIKGLLAMAGGKLTTAQSFAQETLRRVLSELGLKPFRAKPPREPPRLANVPTRIARLYGPRAPELLRYLDRSPDLVRPIHSGCQTGRGEFLFAAEREHARTLAHILLRRTGLAFDASYESFWARRAASIVAPVLGWNGVRASAELRRYERELAQTLLRCAV